jgi:hypothetical protein
MKITVTAIASIFKKKYEKILRNKGLIIFAVDFRPYNSNKTSFQIRKS